MSTLPRIVDEGCCLIDLAETDQGLRGAEIEAKIAFRAFWPVACTDLRHSSCRPAKLIGVGQFASTSTVFFALGIACSVEIAASYWP